MISLHNTSSFACLWETKIKSMEAKYLKKTCLFFFPASRKKKTRFSDLSEWMTNVHARGKNKIRYLWSKGPSTYYVILHTVFYVKRVTFFLVNRVEHQKLNQTTAELPFGWVFGVQLGLRQTQALIRTYYIIIIKEDEDKEEEVKKAQCAHPPPFDNDDVIGSNQCLCLPKAELNTKNSTKRQLFWSSTRLLIKVKKCLGYRGKTCKNHIGSRHSFFCC